MSRPLRRLLIANRGEIAIRIHRACAELGIETVAIHSVEDRYSLHRFKADQAYALGDAGNPVGAYLDIPRILEIARQTGADAVHPGYGFLSENADFARAVEGADIAFVGPPGEVLERLGDKVRARAEAERAGLPLIPGTEPLRDIEEARAAAADIGYPVMVKATGGGGGRGMRMVHDADDLASAYDAARREAGSAFGNDEVFVEKLLLRPKHIEVQILADGQGDVIHLYERDCSIQRRHQKVLELAPAPNLDPELRERLCNAAAEFSRSVDYRNAGTVEFLMSGDDWYFIEMNPRIQVEHTVTEEVTGVDLVSSQIRIAAGESLRDLGLRQEDISTRGMAIQCRVTTENPEKQFLPDYGELISYRSPGGMGVRLDAGSAFPGAIITPYYDSLLVKLTTRGQTLEEAARRSVRALGEFRARGVETNVPYLRKVLEHPTFLAGECTTHFIDETPELLELSAEKGRGTRLLRYLAEVTVNGKSGVDKSLVEAGQHEPFVPAYDASVPPPPGTRQKLAELGTAGFLDWLKNEDRLLITDTTFRDAHQSLLATRLRTHDMLAIAPALARRAPDLFSLEMWGGATFDVAMRFLDEDPWDRLAKLREAIPNILFQMLLRGANAVGYTTYPDNVVREFVLKAADQGIDIFRIFDSLNWPEQMQVAIDAVRETNALAEVAICYTGDILEPGRERYALKYYVDLARELVDRGAHIIAIKDMAGLLKPYSARRLVEALKDAVDVPIHLHSHDTAGIQAAAYLQAAEAGVDVVDCAFGPLSGSTSQPNLQSIVAMLEPSDRATGMDLGELLAFDEYWEAVRGQYGPFDRSPRTGSAEVYEHEIPGGQYTNLRAQAVALGLGDRWREATRMYAEVNEMFGDVVKVTPSSKVVGDMALYMLSNGLTPDDIRARGRDLSFPESVIGFFEGRIGQPAYGFPEELRSIILGDRPGLSERPGADLAPVDFDAAKAELSTKMGRDPEDTEVLSYLLYPRVFMDFEEACDSHGDVSVLPTPAFLRGMQPGEEIHFEVEPGQTLVVRLVAIGEPDSEGKRAVFFDLNGQPLHIQVQDRTLGIVIQERERADVSDPFQIAAPLPGIVASYAVAVGDPVKEGERLCIIEAMKMETNVTATASGRIGKIHIPAGERIESGDLLLTIEPNA